MAAADVLEAYFASFATEQLRAMYYIADKSGAVMIWEMPSLEEIETELQKLLMVKAGVLTCEVMGAPDNNSLL